MRKRAHRGSQVSGRGSERMFQRRPQVQQEPLQRGDSSPDTGRGPQRPVCWEPPAHAAQWGVLSLARSTWGGKDTPLTSGCLVATPLGLQSQRR